MKNILITFLSVFGLNLLIAKNALAMCPICAIAVGAGIELSRILGVDDMITGLWIGGLTVSLITWNLDWFKRKNINFRWKIFITSVIYYMLIVVPLYFMGVIGNPANVILGNWFDKLSLGIILGSVAFWFSAEWYESLKSNNGGKAYFPFQKVAMPVGMLTVLSFLFYFLIK